MSKRKIGCLGVIVLIISGATFGLRKALDEVRESAERAN